MEPRRNNLLAYLGIIGFVLWVTFVVSYYFVIHKPWWDQLILTPVYALIDFCLAFAIICLAGGLGRRVLPGFGGAHPLERVGLALALGLGFLGIGILGLGLVGLISPWIAWLGLIVGLFLLKKDILSWLSEWKSINVDASKVNLLGQVSKVFVWLLFGLNLISALGPPLKWDSLVYHLQIPIQYVSAGRIFFYPENLYAGFPQLAGMLYTWAITLRSVTTATTLSWAVAIVMFISMDGYARRILGERVAWIVPAFLLTGFSISQAMHWGYVDLWVMFYGLMMLISLDQYLTTGFRRWLIMAGLYIGFATSVKYTSGILLIVAGFMVLPVWEVQRKSIENPDIQSKKVDSYRMQIFKSLAWNWIILGTVSLVVMLPWLIKNTLMAGNPFYPAMLWNTTPDPWRQTFVTGEYPLRSIANDLLLPIEATFYGIEGALVEGKLEYGASIGPLMLAFTPGLLLGWKYLADNQRVHIKRLMVAAGTTWVLWSICSHIAKELMWPRHYYGVFPAFAVLAVAGFDSVGRITINHIRMRRILSAFVILSLALSAYTELILFTDKDPLSVVTGRQSMNEYLAQELGWYGVMILDLNDLPANSKILFLWEPRTLFCETVICLPDGTLHNWWYLRNTSGDTGSIQQALCDKELTHVLINDLGLRVVMDLPSSYNQEDWILLDQFKRNGLELVATYGDSYSLYTTHCER